MKLVKIKVSGVSNSYNSVRNNSLLFIKYTEDGSGAYFWMKDSKYAREDAKFSFRKVEFLETIEIPD